MRRVQIVALTCALLLVAAGQASAALVFAPPITVPLPGYAQGIAVGDLNGDGIPDIVTANIFAGTVSVLLGRGDGTFLPAVSYSTGVGTAPNAVAIGDINGDGHADVVTSNGTTGSDPNGSISVLYGNGAGTLSAPSKIAWANPTNPYGVALADVNHDGLPDVITADRSTKSVGVRLNTSTGLSAAATDITLIGAAHVPQLPVVGDFTEDGFVDIAVADPGDGEVWLLPNSGSSPYFSSASATHFAAGASPFSLAAVDLHGNGHLDLAVGTNSGTSVGVLSGNGAGSFTGPALLNTDADPIVIASADFAHDGNQDLVTADNSGNGDLSVLRNTGGAVFAPEQRITGGDTGSCAILTADLSRDGFPDIVESGCGGAPQLLVFRNAPTATASPSGLTFSSQPQETVSPSQTVTITNGGVAPLAISAVRSDSPDFFIAGDSCRGAIAGGGTCTVDVRFAPTAAGARSGNLVVASNAAVSTTTVPLSGIGGLLPTGPPGAPGAKGATGATGPAGPAGKVEVIVCKPTTKTVKGHRRTAQRCTGRLVSGTVKFTTATAATSARVSRARVLYATGYAVSTGRGSWTLMLARRRNLSPGRYTLTLTTRRDGRWSIDRRSITLR